MYDKSTNASDSLSSTTPLHASLLDKNDQAKLSKEAFN